jgi:hypothetical protein
VKALTWSATTRRGQPTRILPERTMMLESVPWCVARRGFPRCLSCAELLPLLLLEHRVLFAVACWLHFSPLLTGVLISLTCCLHPCSSIHHIADPRFPCHLFCLSRSTALLKNRSVLHIVHSPPVNITSARYGGSPFCFEGRVLVKMIRIQE